MRELKETLKQLRVGQSVFVPSHELRISSAIQSTYQVRKETGFKFTGRKYETGYRVWRVE